MRVCFVLPKTNKRASGGYRIVYEYANRICERGFDVSILFLNTNYLKRFHLPKLIKKIYFDITNFIEPRWFELNKKIEKVSDYSTNRVNELFFESDIVFATAAETANYVYKNFITTKKFYLIQGRETWSLSEETVNETYKLGMKNITVSKWLKNIVDSVSQKESFLLSNPINNNIYKEQIPFLNRNKHSIGFLYNPIKCKGFDYTIKVIEKLKIIFPDLIVNAFGAYDRPKEISKWIIYKKNASQSETVEIYNSVRVFLCTSINEGFGLTGFEAISCGCALVTTDFQGAKEYVIDGENALVSPKCDVDSLVKNVCLIFEDEKLALKLVENGKKTASLSNWDKAVDKIIKLFG